MRRAADFRRTIGVGQRAAGRSVVLHWQPGDSTGPGAPDRVGLVVGRQVGGAVVRNRVRRRLREIVRARLPRLPGGSYVVRALPAAADATSARLGQDVDKAIERLTRKPAKHPGLREPGGGASGEVR